METHTILEQRAMYQALAKQATTPNYFYVPKS
jgi:hypothetical protein